MPQTNDIRILQAIDLLDEKQQFLHATALAEGYKDEVCNKCGLVFMAFHHFVRCQDPTCPMIARDKDGKSKTVLEMMLSGLKAEPKIDK